MADPRIPLVAYLPNNLQPSVGEIVLGDPMLQDNEVVFRGRYLAETQSLALERFVHLGIRLTSEASRHKPWGVVDSDARDVVQLSGSPYSTVTFKWHLTHSDLEVIERHRAGARYVTFNIAVEGWAFVAQPQTSATELHPVRGEGQLRLSVTDWEDKVLTPLGYKLPPSWDRLLPDPEGRERPELTKAEQRLGEARKALRRGEVRDALGAALDAFESVLSQPYSAANWRTKLEKVPEDLLPKQKREAVAEMLGGLCTYLNRVGHHRGRTPDPTNLLPAMPVDQWEAEYAIAAAHFLLPLALRIVAEAKTVGAPQQSPAAAGARP